MGFITLLTPPQLSIIQPWIKLAMDYLKYRPWLSCTKFRANYQIAVVMQLTRLISRLCRIREVVWSWRLLGLFLCSLFQELGTILRHLKKGVSGLLLKIETTGRKLIQLSLISLLSQSFRMDREHEYEYSNWVYWLWFPSNNPPLAMSLSNKAIQPSLIQFHHHPTIPSPQRQH